MGSQNLGISLLLSADSGGFSSAAEPATNCDIGGAKTRRRPGRGRTQSRTLHHYRTWNQNLEPRTQTERNAELRKDPREGVSELLPANIFSFAVDPLLT